MIKLKKDSSKISKQQQPKPSGHFEPLMDTEGEIHDPFCPLNLSDLCFDFYSCSLNKEDPFCVIKSGLCENLEAQISTATTDYVSSIC